LHEIKHDGHRLLAIVAGDDVKLISRNGHDRTHLFRAPFRGLTGPSLVLDGEIAVPDVELSELWPCRSEIRSSSSAYRKVCRSSQPTYVGS
jgi:ATP-dependent DNA ligase